MYAGSRNHYRRRTDERDPWYRRLVRWASGGRYGKLRVEKCVYWLAVKQNPWIEDLCRSHPDYIFYGEIFGWVQKLRYGATEAGMCFMQLSPDNPRM